MSQPPKKKSFKIEPFKHRVELDPGYAEKTWKVIGDAIDEIYNHNASGLSFEELYRNAYNMVLHKYGDKLYSGLVAAMTTNLRIFAISIEEAQGDVFLVEFNSKWEDHNKALQMIRDILMYMDRTYVVNSKKTPVHELGLQLWREQVEKSSKIKDRLESSVLDLIHKERCGEAVDRSLLRHIVKMYADLGSAVYEADFENPFLNATMEFYKREASELLGDYSCPDYLRKTEKRLSEEADRVKHYIDVKTEPKLLAVVEAEMIEKHMGFLVEEEASGMVPLIERQAYDDLSRMHLLFRRVATGTKAMLDVMSAHLREEGKKIVTNPESAQSPLLFVQSLLQLKEKYDRLVKHAFGGDKQFQNAMNSCFESFVNLSPRSAEFISLFIDDVLRRGLKGITEEEAEGILDCSIVLFRFLQDKDMFEKYYKAHLAKRLLSGRSVSDDAERSLIVKLKTECGYQFTSKLEGMFTDMKTSRDASDAFLRAFPDHPDHPALAVQVLTTGFWPMPATPACILPAELYPACDRFKQHYLTSHTGRRLTWQTSQGSADIRACFDGRKYELNVSTYQMCVLMLFNRASALTYKDIQQATEIAAPDLKRSLQSLALVKGKNVLHMEPAKKEVEDSDVFAVNEAFSSKLYKVKIGTVAPLKESEPEKQETRQRVEEDRKPQIEAAIVRIMKTRKVLDHNNIISEVTSQLQARFMPNPALIKKRIESLIEREFLERDKVDRKLYRYLA